MADPKFYGLGPLIAIASIINFVGVFTPCWLSGKYVDFYGRKYEQCDGIVLYYRTEPPWLAASSWLMFITVAFAVITLIIYFIAQAKVLQNGYSCGARKWFILISLFSALIVLMTIAAVIVFGINFSRYMTVTVLQINLGYSAWISVGAAVIFLGVSALSVFISHRECCD